jgi:hypothetical protein
MTPAEYSVSALSMTRQSSGEPDIHTASGAGTSVAGLEGLLVVSLAEIVGAAVHDDGALHKVLYQSLYPV